MSLSPRTIFIAFLSLGLLSGVFAGQLRKALAAPLPASAQGAVLIALADDLNSAQPNLLGLWRVQQAEDGVWQWTPVYPAPLAENAGPHAQPHAAIKLSQEQLRDPSGQPPVGHAGSWRQVFWLDSAALALLSELAGGQPSALSPTWSSPQRALREQVEAINALCQGAGEAAVPGSLDAILALLPRRLRTSASPFELITAWDQWLSQGAPLACSHSWAG